MKRTLLLFSLVALVFLSAFLRPSNQINNTTASKVDSLPLDTLHYVLFFKDLTPQQINSLFQTISNSQFFSASEASGWLNIANMQIAAQQQEAIKKFKVKK